MSTELCEYIGCQTPTKFFVYRDGTFSVYTCAEHLDDAIEESLRQKECCMVFYATRSTATNWTGTIKQMYPSVPDLIIGEVR